MKSSPAQRSARRGKPTDSKQLSDQRAAGAGSQPTVAAPQADRISIERHASSSESAAGNGDQQAVPRRAPLEGDDETSLVSSEDDELDEELGSGDDEEAGDEDEVSENDEV